MDEFKCEEMCVVCHECCPSMTFGEWVRFALFMLVLLAALGVVGGMEAGTLRLTP